MGTKTGGIVAVVLLSLKTGCAGLKSVAGIQQNPLVQGTINVASQAQCKQFAHDEPDDAKTTAQYLSTLHGATAACMDGIAAGLAEPNP